MGRSTGLGGGWVVFVLVLAMEIVSCQAGAVVAVDPGSDWVAAVLGAPTGASVVFSPGTYKNCTAGGLAPLRDVALVGSGGATATVIDCEGSGRQLFVRGNISVLLQGLTLRDGRSSGGGGCVELADGAEVAIEDSVLDGCNAALSGGAVSVGAGS
jgi:hypothetical protein